MKKFLTGVGILVLVVLVLIVSLFIYIVRGSSFPTDQVTILDQDNIDGQEYVLAKILSDGFQDKAEMIALFKGQIAYENGNPKYDNVLLLKSLENTLVGATFEPMEGKVHVTYEGGEKETLVLEDW